MGNEPRLSGEPFTFQEDTISGRRWRVADGWLECEAMGGWKRIFEVADGTDLARRLAWLSGANPPHHLPPAPTVRPLELAAA